MEKKIHFVFFFLHLYWCLYSKLLCTRKCLIPIIFTIAKDIGGSTCTFEDSERVLT